MGIAFLPLLPSPPGGLPSKVFGVAALTACAALVAWGGALLYPFEMDTIVRLSGDRKVATYYGAYNTCPASRSPSETWPSARSSTPERHGFPGPS